MNFKKIISFATLSLLVLLAGTVSAQNIGSLKSVVTPGFSFTMDLSPGYTDSDVRELQKVLNADVDTTVALEGDGSRGKETKYFGEKTKAAVIKFQEKYRDTILTPAGLTKGTGIVNKATRTKLNLLIGVFDTRDSVGSPESRGGSGVSSGSTGATVYIPPAPAASTQTTSTMTNCQYIELFISVEVIAPKDAGAARSAFNCSGSSTLTPRVDVKVNGKDSTVEISSARNVTVSWTSSNVTSCTSPNGNKPLSGSQSYYVDRSGTFVVSCTGPYGTVTDSVAVRLYNDDDDDNDNTNSNLSVSCLANPISAQVSVPITWTATVFGGSSNQTYSWSGTNDLTGTAKSISKTYSTAGNKEATVRVTSNGQTKSATCQATVVTTINPLNNAGALLPTYNPISINSFYNYGKKITGPSDVINLTGYGVVNKWMNIDSASLAVQLATNGLTATNIELLGYGIDGYYDNPTALQANLKTFITNMRTQNITTVINMVNWSKGVGVFENSKVSICDPKYDDAWFNGLLDMVINTASTAGLTASSTDKIILQAVGEWGGNGFINSQCFDKAQRWEDQMNTRWAGMKSTNKGIRPFYSPRSGWFFEYRPCSIVNYGADGSIVTTTCGDLLSDLNQNENIRALADTVKLKSYACQVKKTGNKGFMYYGFGHSQIDSNAIKTLGQVVANPSASCEEEEEEEEESDVAGPERFFQFGGVVTGVSACNNENSNLWLVSIKSCRAGDAVSVQETTGISNTADGYIVIRDGYQSVPSVGQTVLGRAVDDQGFRCSNGSGAYIGTVTGEMGTGENCYSDITETSGTRDGSSLWSQNGAKNGALVVGTWGTVGGALFGSFLGPAGTVLGAAGGGVAGAAVGAVVGGVVGGVVDTISDAFGF